MNAAAGRLVVDGFTDDVAELYLAAPPIRGIRPNLIFSVPLDDLTGDATVLAQLSWDPWPGIGFDAGVVDTPVADATGTLGAHVIQPLWGGPVTLTVLHSVQPAERTQTTVVKLGLTWFRR